MKIYNSFSEIERSDNHIITVGTFDGVHLGHQQILKRLKEVSMLETKIPLVITFHPHPQFVIQRQDKLPLQLLNTIEERIKLFERFGVENVLIVNFTKEFANTHATDFVVEYLYKLVGFSKIFVGHDHFFGKNREGNYELLMKISNELNFKVERIPPFIFDGVTISSTKIRNAISQNQIELANKFLGYDYFIDGIVVTGDGRGANLGFPTANIKFEEANKLVPSNGVYLVYSFIDGRKIFGMANLGFRPTFYTDRKRVLEVHYLNFNGNLYQKQISVHFLKFIREERKFNSVDDLLIQLNNDKELCQKMINIHNESTL
ncbi:MAG: bifunctional riboflavin kinase/FAD synthetase [Ignavibacteria bacterium]|nr:bifunctional riboflavin kinase/FAD synthetase [Ignavibacteria bacterium]